MKQQMKNNIELASDIADELVEKLFGFVAEYNFKTETEEYTKEAQDLFNTTYDVVLKHLDKYLDNQQLNLNQ